MLDYMEKQMILSYHFRGEQDSFEKEFPDMVAKAKKYLGFELYFALAPFQNAGRILKPDSEDIREKECYN